MDKSEKREQKRKKLIKFKVKDGSRIRDKKQSINDYRRGQDKRLAYN